MSRTPLVAGNWKMNGLKASLGEAQAIQNSAVDVLICPPATLITAMADALAGSGIGVGAQNCHSGEKGAHTGEIAPEMLRDAGATSVILGHSERRTDNGESSDLVRQKTSAVWRAELTAIVCVGESAIHREARNTLDIISGQLAASIPDGATAHNLIVAYEPLWAIGSGKTPSLDEIGEVHSNVDGGLVGGASLKADEFNPIIAAAQPG